ncbi:putative ATP-grasp-modified RiPP [Streptacidiphilus sp. P02-A3a]|uniref:putative ATP-grasp-modified RiPP n=1 Tax=Streptacidiphilus sp. P02-A3a TaxID=2704468 RepID=UPI0015F79A4A|nr:putative ATP-grasp-modified RiPP [Streptacidiphilus sp. P02-A3a]QMU68279.1 putative ATP-grasp-modified RiPP [Streptacidiphilus sp. P02-A3a]
MQNTLVRPWGLRRMRSYAVLHEVPFTTVEVNTVDQLGVFRDAEGTVVEMGKHGTLKGTNKQTPGSTNQDSRSDPDYQQDSDQD